MVGPCCFQSLVWEALANLFDNVNGYGDYVCYNVGDMVLDNSDHGNTQPVSCHDLSHGHLHH